MKNKLIGWILCIGMILSLQQVFVAGASSGINNASLTPKWVPDSQVVMEGTSPDWIKTLMMEQFRIETVSDTHDFAGAVKALDHFQEMGINGIWVNPVYQKSEANRAGSNNGYSIYAYDQIDSVMTGTTDKEQSFVVAKKFVDEAHKRNIRVFFDIVVWGVDKESPLVTQHPDWVSKNGTLTEGWGGYLFNWGNAELREWYTNNAVQIALKTGIDGFRCDLEPHITGYNLWSDVRSRLLLQGRKIAIISEGTSSRMGGTYDFEQVGVGEEPDAAMKWDAQDYFLTNNMVDCVKTGKGIGNKTFQITGHGGEFRFYTINLLTHDSNAPRVRGNKVKIGYQAIFSPFIPFWNIGEEWNNPRKLMVQNTGVMYFNTIQWEKRDTGTGKEFFEAVKKMIQIRRTYPEIFQYYPDNHKDVNICKVESAGNSLQAYARFANGKGIIVVPNIDETKTMSVIIPYTEMKMLGANGYKITDLITGTVIKSDVSSKMQEISIEVQSQDQRVLLVEATSTLPVQPTSIPSTQQSSTGGVSSQSTSTSQQASGSDTDSSISGNNSSDESNVSDIDTTKKVAMFTTLQLVLICVGALVIIGSAFMIFYYLLINNKIFKKK